MNRLELRAKIKEHYNLVSPYYYKLWGEHIHHGYWITGKESKEKAQQNLTELLIKKAQIKKNSSVLDIGCGVGGSSRYLASKLNCKVKGITISEKQVEIAESLSRNMKNSPTFEVMDANNLSFKEKFDVLWAVEMISHLDKRGKFFKNCARIMQKGNIICIADWMKDEHIGRDAEKEYIAPLEHGMLVKLSTPNQYVKYLEENGLKVRYVEDISKNVAKTWDICLDLIKNKEFWSLAFKEGPEFISFLKAFRTMRDDFASGIFRYYVFVAEK